MGLVEVLFQMVQPKVVFDVSPLHTLVAWAWHVAAVRTAVREKCTAASYEQILFLSCLQLFVRIPTTLLAVFTSSKSNIRGGGVEAASPTVIITCEGEGPLDDKGGGSHENDPGSDSRSMSLPPIW